MICLYFVPIRKLMKRKHQGQKFEKNKKGSGYYKDSFVENPWLIEEKEKIQSPEKEKMYYKESFIKDPWSDI
jgi:hypothetical protein